MYIFELINKLKSKNKAQTQEFIEPELIEGELEDVSTCKHVFMPIDSTKTVLACSKCGYVIKNDKMKFNETDKNPFKSF